MDRGAWWATVSRGSQRVRYDWERTHAHNSETPRWKRSTEKVYRRYVELPCLLLSHHAPQISECSPTGRFSEPCPSGYLQRPSTHTHILPLHSHSWLNHCPLAIDSATSPSSFLEVKGWNWKFQPGNHMVDSLSNQSHLKVTSLI